MLSGRSFLAVFAPEMDIMPAAGPQGPSSGGMGNWEGYQGTMIDGVGRLDGLDTGFDVQREPVQTLETSGFGRQLGEVRPTGQGLAAGPHVPAPGQDPVERVERVEPVEPIEPVDPFHARLIVSNSEPDSPLRFFAQNADGSLVTEPSAVNLVFAEGTGHYFNPPQIDPTTGRISLTLTDAGRDALASGEQFEGTVFVITGGHTYPVDLLGNDDGSYDFGDREAERPMEGALKSEWYESDGEQVTDEMIRLGGDTYNNVTITRAETIRDSVASYNTSVDLTAQGASQGNVLIDSQAGQGTAVGYANADGKSIFIDSGRQGLVNISAESYSGDAYGVHSSGVGVSGGMLAGLVPSLGARGLPGAGSVVAEAASTEPVVPGVPASSSGAVTAPLDTPGIPFASVFDDGGSSRQGRALGGTMIPMMTPPAMPTMAPEPVSPPLMPSPMPATARTGRAATAMPTSTAIPKPSAPASRFDIDGQEVNIQALATGEAVAVGVLDRSVGNIRAEMVGVAAEGGTAGGLVNTGTLNVRSADAHIEARADNGPAFAILAADNGRTLITSEQNALQLKVEAQAPDPEDAYGILAQDGGQVVIDADEATGNSEIEITGHVVAEEQGSVDIRTGEGDDTVAIDGHVISRGEIRVDTGAGDDAFSVSGNVNAEGFGTVRVDTGSGDDTVHVDGSVETGRGVNTIGMGQGADSLTVGGDLTLGSSTVVDLGDGNDAVAIGGGLLGTGTLDGGDGYDSISFDSVRGVQVDSGQIRGFEHIDLQNTGQDMLTLNFGDVVSDSGIQEIQLDGMSQAAKAMFLQLDASDTLNLDGNVTNTGQTYIADGVEYQVHEWDNGSGETIYLMLNNG